MNILLINGNPDSANKSFDNYILGYQVRLHKTGHYVKTYNLREMKINEAEKFSEPPLQEERFRPADDVGYIINSLNDIDLLVFASPLTEGHITVLTQRVQARIVRYLQTNLATKVHHWNRYTTILQVPLFGLILQPELSTTQQEILLNKLTQERIATNLKTVLSFQITTEHPLADAVCKTFRSFDMRQFIFAEN